MKWREPLKTGQYYQLFERGFFDKKPDDLEPDTTGFGFYLDAFRELSTSRPAGMELSAIPFTAIVEYFRIYEIQDDFDEFAYIIRHMDNTYLEESDRVQKAEREKNAKRDSDKKNPNKS